MTHKEAINLLGSMKVGLFPFSDVVMNEVCNMAIQALAENKREWIPFSKELPPKGEKVHVSTFGIVTIGERTSEADENLRLSILEPMNNMYKNVDPYAYQITHWQPLPEPYKAERGTE